MTASAGINPERPTGFRFHELAAAFDRVMDPRDWQAPIRSVIPATERQLVEKAVRCFTQTAATFEAAPGELDHLVITAPGYRLGRMES
jgi:hypothetical protein